MVATLRKMQTLVLLILILLTDLFKAHPIRSLAKLIFLVLV